MRILRPAVKWIADAVGLVQLVYYRHFMAVICEYWIDNRHKDPFYPTLFLTNSPITQFARAPEMPVLGLVLFPKSSSTML
jgi:hypothetical protein